MRRAATVLKAEHKLAQEAGRFYDDPYGWVMFAYPWGVQGSALELFSGPDEWQKRFLVDLGEIVKERAFDGLTPVEPIRMATASGHGIGKSALVAWLVGWLTSTRPGCKGTVTANKAQQLEARTWSEVSKWNNLSCFGQWFDVRTSRGSMKLFRTGREDEWRVDAVTCKKENSEGFAGQHSATSSSFFIFDEASLVPPSIFDVAEGGLTDGEPFFMVFGNPTRSSGRFFDCFHRFRDLWNTRQIDARTGRIPNHDLHKQWIETWGEDSDFVRVRILGKFPRASSLQLISNDLVEEARSRDEVLGLDDPLLMGIDVARGGSDRSRIQFRRGQSSRCRSREGTCPNGLTLLGEDTRDTMKLVSAAVHLAQEHRPDTIFVDATGVGGPIADRLRQLGFNAVDVQFGGKSPDPQQANLRTHIWWEMREWLKHAAIDDDEELETDLTGPEYGHNGKDLLMLESKEHMRDQRDLASPDLGDALAMTFALYVPPKSLQNRSAGPPAVGQNYNPLEVRR